MEKAKIDGYQLFVLVVLFEMGSAIVVSLGSSARQDAWIAILLGLSGGIFLFHITYQLYKYYPDLPLTGYAQKIAGKVVGRFIGFLYIIYFIYGASRVLRDFGELLTSTIYSHTPLLIINSLMILTIIYTVIKGIEVLARVGELFFIVVYILAILGMLLIIFSKLIQVDHLRPILENGWKPVFKVFLGETLTFPFGEMIIFSMILPNLNKPDNAKKICLSAMILSGINITITSMINIACLGVDLFMRSPFPLLNTVSRIEIANFIERLDVLFMLYLIIGGFFKVTIFFYGAVIGASDIFGFKNYRVLSLPIGLLVLFASMMIASNFSEHIKEGLQIVPKYLHWPFQIIIPTLLLLVAFIKKKRKKYNQRQPSETKNING
ncbi:GerAB/ArcD/ProY family transporter [Cytobacillus sp. Hz8]|uniref:GerAB/ArcD/ProY family transporter n=1 Tax=Cytobacillus sp. Hz8 TaxID=3347168 RepID=UPI0035D73959